MYDLLTEVAVELIAARRIALRKLERRMLPIERMNIQHALMSDDDVVIKEQKIQALCLFVVHVVRSRIR